MRGKNPSLHGNAPDQSPAALLVIDLISDFDFEGGPALLDRVLPMARRLAALMQRARAAGVPVVYVNDNYGRWRSNFQQQVAHVLDGTPGEPVTRLLMPQETDYFVLKPKRSGFYSTTLGLLLEYLGARTLVLTGVNTEVCVLFTANDAYMREFDLVLPTDGVASFNDEDHDAALGLMARTMQAQLTTCEAVDFAALSREG